jgi:type II secretory pathway pseudopilin PulG
MPASRVTARLAARLGALRTGSDTSDADGGFILVEAIVSMVIFAIVAAGATTAVIGGIQGSSVTQTRVSTANIAQQAVQQAEAMPKASLAATPIVTSTATAGNAKYTVTRTVQFATPTAGQVPTACPTAVSSGTPYAMVVHVSVTGAGKNARTVAMDTVISC